VTVEEERQAEEKRALIMRWDRIVLGCVLIAIPILVSLGLFLWEFERRVDDIQQSRAEITYMVCLDQNQRNTDATEAVNAIFAEAIERGADPDTLTPAREGTQTVIDALAPIRDCAFMVERQFGYVPSGV
jgi:hypothetical protein